MARWLILAGIVLIAAGTLMHFAPWMFSWFGRLPGDIRYESGRSRVFVPVTSMIIVSVLLTLAVNVVRRIMG
ncbi:MAG: DUF2905 domain-containing protein [Balneolales bacterium]